MCHGNTYMLNLKVCLKYMGNKKQKEKVSVYYEEKRNKMSTKIYEHDLWTRILAETF